MLLFAAVVIIVFVCFQLPEVLAQGLFSLMVDMRGIRAVTTFCIMFHKQQGIAYTLRDASIFHLLRYLEIFNPEK